MLELNTCACICFSFGPGLSVNGRLDATLHGGFKKIVIHSSTDVHIEVETTGITVREGQTQTSHTGQDLITAGR